MERKKDCMRVRHTLCKLKSCLEQLRARDARSNSLVCRWHRHRRRQHRRCRLRRNARSAFLGKSRKKCRSLVVFSVQNLSAARLQNFSDCEYAEAECGPPLGSPAWFRVRFLVFSYSDQTKKVLLAFISVWYLFRPFSETENWTEETKTETKNWQPL